MAGVLAGCAQTGGVRTEAMASLRQGDYESAIAALEQGVRASPSDAALRGSLLSARGEATTRLLAEAAQARTEGRFEAADEALARAIRLDPGNGRLAALRQDLVLDARAQEQLRLIENQVKAGNRRQALALAEAALQAAPRHAGLLALQRRLTAELRIEAGGGGLRLAETRPIALDFRQTSLGMVLEAITYGSGINFVLDREVQKEQPVTIHLRATRVEDAIELVTAAHRLAYRVIDAQTVLVYPNTPDKRREHQEQVIRVFHLANADAKATAALLRAMLKVQEPFVDERSNVVALREPPEVIALAERLVALHDVGAPEVMLEVEVLEVSATRLTELGLNFPSSFSLTPLSASGSSSDLTVSDLRGLNAGRLGVNVGSLILNLRREVGDVNILANPRIRAKNREKAEILIGDKVPVFTSTSGSTGFVSESVNYLDVGLKLNVEPIISPDDEVEIKLGLEVSSLAGQVQTSNGSVAYRIGTRNASTTLRLRDGETQVLAGLINNEDRSTANRVPGLGDLPVAGRLFSSQRDDVQRTELVLAITPRIVRGAARPDAGQAELWVGSEESTRLRPSPWQRAARPAAAGGAPAAGPSPAVEGGTAEGAPAGPAPVPPAQADERAGERVREHVGEDASAFVFPPAGADVPEGQPVLRLGWQAPAGVRVGEGFDAVLFATATADLKGIPLEIGYPADRLAVESVAEGGYMLQKGGTTSFTHAVNAQAGRIGVGVLRNDGPPLAGQGELLRVRFKPLKAGAAEIVLTSVQPIGVGTAVAVPQRPSLKLDVQP
ncbi:MAG: general secretion pathway protein GspD [Comamonas sp.]